jgi:hypothetical protein
MEEEEYEAEQEFNNGQEDLVTEGEYLEGGGEAAEGEGGVAYYPEGLEGELEEGGPANMELLVEDIESRRA